MLSAVLAILVLAPSLLFGEPSTERPADNASASHRQSRESATLKTACAPPIPLHQIEGARVLVRDNVTLSAEYRRKPGELKRVPRVLANEGDRWTLAAAYLVNDRRTLSAAYANLGTVLDREEPAALRPQVKFEF
jgi:hypothetical protein